MSDSKPCRTCGLEQAMSQFKKLSPLMVERSVSGLTHGRDCKACRLKMRIERARQDGVEVPEAAPQSEESTTNPTLSVPMAMPVDVEWDGNDFILTQENGETTHTVYMAPHVLRRLWEFGEGLAQQHASQSSGSANT